MGILSLSLFAIPFVAIVIFLLRKKTHKKMYWMPSSMYDDGGLHNFGGHGFHHDGGHH